MRTDNSHHLRDAAQRKHEECLERVTTAIHEADRLRRPVTVQGIAKVAGVSASWIYTQPDVYDAIRSRRSESDRHRSVRVPNGQKAGPSSQQKRIELLALRLRETVEDNERLRRELAAVHFELRRLRQQRPRQNIVSESGKKEQ